MIRINIEFEERNPDAAKIAVDALQDFCRRVVSSSWPLARYTAAEFAKALNTETNELWVPTKAKRASKAKRAKP